MNNHRGTGKSDRKVQHAGSVESEHPEGGRPGERHEVGNAASSRRHPPHVTENEEGAPIQGNESRAKVPALPPNASGRDRIPTEESPRKVDSESMYDGRPAEDKDQPPSETGGA